MKFTMVLILICIYSQILLAQEKKIEISPIIGVEFPFALGKEENLEFNYQPRPFTGAAFKVSINDKFALQPEILFQYRDVNIKDSNFRNNSYSYYSIIYLVIPVYVNYHISENFSLLMGPRIGFDLSSSTNFAIGFDDSLDTSDAKRPEFGGVIGFQYTTPIKIFVSLKGHYSFTNPNYATEINEAGLMIGFGRFF